jgi:hypothetical protein
MRLALMFLALIAAGCVQTTTAPTETEQTRGILTIVVLDRATHVPIPAAHVVLQQAVFLDTDADGRVVFRCGEGRWGLDVTANGYRPFSVLSDFTGQETWTVYLEKESS